MEFDRVRLKRDVRASMKGSGCMMVTLLFSLAVSVGTWLIDALLGGALTGGLGNWSTMLLAYVQAGYEMDEAVEQALLALLSRGPGAIFGVAVGGMVLSILVSLWQGVMEVGYEGWCLSMVRREGPPMSKIFAALPLIGPVLITRFLTGLFTVLWSLPVVLVYCVVLAIAGVMAAFTGSVALTLLFVLAALAVLLLGMVWVTTRYALVDYVLLDRGLSGLDAIRENKRLMQGQMGRCFALRLSFAGWYLLEAGVFLALAIAAGVTLGAGYEAVLSASDAAALMLAGSLGLVGLALLAGIGIAVLDLWLRPYITGTLARFYDWCTGADGGQSGSAGGWGPAGYTWTTGPAQGTGLGSGPRDGGALPPKAPPKPRDDPWE